MLAPNDAVGDKGVTMLYVVGYKRAATASSRRYQIAQFRCPCGESFEARVANVKSGKTSSCGCKRNSRRAVETHPIFPMYDGLITTFGAIEMCSTWLKNPRRFFKWVTELATDYNYPIELVTTFKLARIDEGKPWSPSNTKIDMADAGWVGGKLSRWRVHGEDFPTAADAAKHHKVSVSTIYNWCVGYSKEGVTIAPREGCYRIDTSKYIASLHTN